MENELLGLIDSANVTINVTRRAARIVYDLICEESTRLKGLTYTTPISEMDKLAAIEMRMTDLESFSECLYFDAGLDPESDNREVER